MCKNIDGYRLSTFMHKDREGPLRMGPQWDFNLSLRNADYLEGWIPQGWYYEDVGAGDYLWYTRMFQDPDFITEYSQRWTEIRADILTTERLMADIDNNVELLNESQQRNFQKWRILGTYVWPNPNPLARTYQQEIDLMKQWLDSRLEWMDAQLLAPPQFSVESGVVEAGTEVELSGGAEMYYTLDGVSDPRTAEDRFRYTGPIVISQNTRIIARTLSGVDLESYR